LLYYEDREAVVFDGMKYIRSSTTGREELYDLLSDPQERTSLSAIAPQKLQRGKELLAALHEKARELREHYFEGRPTSQRPPSISKERLEQLRSLGYLR
jgi:hypothetical protein